MGIKNIFYTGIFLVGTAIAALLNSCASSSKFTEQEILNELKRRDNIVAQEKSKDHIKGSLDNLVRMSLSYKDEPKSKILYGKTGEGATLLNNPLFELTPEEGSGVETIFNSIKTSTYNEFISGLSQLNEKQITITLSSLAKILAEILYKDGNSNLNSEEVYLLVKDFLNDNPTKESITCRHIHNFVSETARKAGLPETITFLCESKDEKHVASALWWPNGSIKIIDYDEIYTGNSNLELLLSGYQKAQGVPAFSHDIYRKEKHIFAFTTADGEIFYNAVNHPDNTLQLKQILTGQESKKDELEVKVGNTENSVKYSKKNLFGKIGALRGAENTWGGEFFQAGMENSINNSLGLFNINLLVTNIEDCTMLGVCGNIIYGKKIRLNPFDELSMAGQLATLTDFKGAAEQNTLTNEKDWLSLGIGLDYAHRFDKNTRFDIYALIRIEPVYGSVLIDKIEPYASEIRTGLKLTSGNNSINPEYTFDNKSDTFSLEAKWNYSNLDISFKLSTSDTRYKRIWPDENSFKLSTTYTFTDDFSIGGSAEYSKKKWPSDESYNSEAKFWIESRF